MLLDALMRAFYRVLNARGDQVGSNIYTLYSFFSQKRGRCFVMGAYKVNDEVSGVICSFMIRKYYAGNGSRHSVRGAIRNAVNDV